MFYDDLKKLQVLAECAAPHVVRIVAELRYADGVSRVNGNKYATLLEGAVALLMQSLERDGAITRSVAAEAERMLLPMQDDAKKYRVHCVSHAHIDMNWMWGYQETVSVTVDTFRTVLNLMKEYPTLTFAQSQASTYKIIEKHAPSMLSEIKERVQEGRWEVSASTWVETDKNMPCGESLARHILYTKRYLSALLDIPAESLQLDFEPDTFGHNISVPEICAAGGVKYYYHCRGNNDSDHVYRWSGRNGGELLVYREPHWYNAEVKAEMLWDTALACEKMGTNCILNVYGVGDHGGGPTRRDVERLLDMATWPIMPTVFFSTYAAFFAELEKFRDRLPVRKGELNFLFDGCYTSQAKIKMANRIAEARIYESEVLDTEAALAGGEHFAESFRAAWENILFNQFHDILPGSGVADTREYAMGVFQEAMATVGTTANMAMRSIARRINTTAFDLKADPQAISLGAGVGFDTAYKDHYRMPCTERGMGKTRLLHFFNTSQYDFDGVTEVTVWDWNYDAGRAVFTDTSGAACQMQFLQEGKKYWGHHFKDFAVHVKVPAFGYASYLLDERPAEAPAAPRLPHERVENDDGDDLILENSRIRAAFDHRTMQLKSLRDKRYRRELIEEPSCTFRLITENTERGMTAWRVGDYMSVEELNKERNVRLIKPQHLKLGGALQKIDYEFSFGKRSKATVCVSLREGSAMLDFDVTVDFHEVGTKEGGIPQLNFAVPFDYPSEFCRFDVPYGTLDRAAFDHDVPANSFAVALPEAGSLALMLISDSKYGFRYTEQQLALALIRASYNPDPYPEYGVHHIRLGVGICETVKDNALLYRMADEFLHPISYCTADLQERGGDLSADGVFLRAEGSIRVTALKSAEDGKGVVVRFAGVGDVETPFALTLTTPVKGAYDSDLNEARIAPLTVCENGISGKCAPYEIKTVIFEL